MKKNIFPVLILTILLLASAGCAPLPSSVSYSEPDTDEAGFSVRFIDVGQGDSSLVCCDGHYMLIDGGDTEAGSTVTAVLAENEVSHLDLLVMSHMHTDHIGGLTAPLSYVSDIGVVLGTSCVYDSDAFEDVSRQIAFTGSSITVPSPGDTYQLGRASVEVLDYGEQGNDSIVLLVTYGETTFLFTGDIEQKMEERLCEKFHDELPVTLLKVAHHGSDSSTSIRFLRMLMPEYAVISVGRGNRYGHPSENTLSRLRQAGTIVFRTDIDGDIFVRSDGQTLTVIPEKD